jgi:hypothetical protein
MKLVAVAIAVSVLLTGCCPCPITPQPPPVDDASAPVVVESDAGESDADLEADGDTAVGIYAKACSNLAKLGCEEGQRSNCVSVMRQGQVNRMADFKPQCLATAKTKADARACKTVKCP